MENIPKTRKEALILGSPRYFTGEPCKNGHVAERITARNDCIECKRARCRKNMAKKYREDPVFAAAMRKRFKDYLTDKRKNDPEYLEEDRRKSRERQAERRKQTGDAYAKRYRKENAEKLKADYRNRNAMKRNAEGSHSKDDIRDILRLQSHKCAYCRVDLSGGYHVDHIMPLIRGGRNDRANLQCLCATCNLRKNAKHPLKFARSLGLLM